MAKRESDPGSARRAREALARKYEAEAAGIEAMQSNLYHEGVEASKVKQPKPLTQKEVWAGKTNEPTAAQARAANATRVGKGLSDLENMAARPRKFAATARRMNGGK